MRHAGCCIALRGRTRASRVPAGAVKTRTAQITPSISTVSRLRSGTTLKPSLRPGLCHAPPSQRCLPQLPHRLCLPSYGSMGQRRTSLDAAAGDGQRGCCARHGLAGARDRRCWPEAQVAAGRIAAERHLRTWRQVGPQCSGPRCSAPQGSGLQAGLPRPGQRAHASHCPHRSTQRPPPLQPSKPGHVLQRAR